MTQIGSLKNLRNLRNLRAKDLCGGVFQQTATPSHPPAPSSLETSGRAPAVAQTAPSLPTFDKSLRLRLTRGFPVIFNSAQPSSHKCLSHNYGTVTSNDSLGGSNDSLPRSIGSLGGSTNGTGVSSGPIEGSSDGTGGLNHPSYSSSHRMGGSNDSLHPSNSRMPQSTHFLPSSNHFAGTHGCLIHAISGAFSFIGN